MRAAGFEIIETNVRLKNSEIDIIAFDPRFQELVFVEVKTRASSEFGNPSTAVTKQKVLSLQKVAKKYLKQCKLTYDYRFDTIAVLPESIEHFKNITWGM